MPVRTIAVMSGWVRFAYTSLTTFSRCWMVLESVGGGNPRMPRKAALAEAINAGDRGWVVGTCTIICGNGGTGAGVGDTYGISEETVCCSCEPAETGNSH